LTVARNLFISFASLLNAYLKSDRLDDLRGVWLGWRLWL